jgi:tRNA(His) 5'-end guanylyltransferase
MLRLVKQVDGSVFAYQYSDQIVLIIRNDQTKQTDPWFGNRQQSIVSMSASIATYEFNDLLLDLDDAPELNGPPLFSVNAFALPNITETIACIVDRQNECIRTSISHAVLHELSSRMGRKEVQRLLDGQGLERRVELLDEECGIDYNTYYPTAFRRGVACYRSPTLVDGGQVTRHKWRVDEDLPLFVDGHDFLFRILSTGHDIFRHDRDYDK